ncbi:MAG TPA: hypothetical protein VFG86_02780, partial [Chloroflexota bacterium]|nr:hypothetical protein [Chloroflexota bacterium]
QYFTVGLGMLGGDILRFTGRDLQPAWAHIPTSAATALKPSDNGSAPPPTSADGTTPAARPRAASGSRPARQGGSKGRKRGKR